ncbi:MAG: hypothetical protein JOZ38_02855 [Candidatus Eremiobacteraeota bacterium]|nr:hypothetical protein [Candidatus Eremiobacteraeota bacterium]
MKRTLALIACAVLIPCVAEAKGTVRVQQSDGSVQVYRDVTLRVVGKTLQITTADSKGTLVITDAACSFVDALMRCLPYHYTLVQNGAHLLDFEYGTVYYNPTKTKQTLRYSSTQLEPDGVLAAVKSKRGTYVSISGTLDGRKP